MSPKAKEWDAKRLLKLYKLRVTDDKTWDEISKIFKTTKSSVANRFRRISWEEFLKDPEAYADGNVRLKKWTDEEMIQLDAYIQADKSYDFIAEKLNRTIVSTERQAQQTDWNAWRKIRYSDPLKDTDVTDEDEEQRQAILLEQVVEALISVCRNDFNRLRAIKEKDFLTRVNLDKSFMPISFTELKGIASDRLVELGYGNEESLDLKAGRYVVVGDSHGKHTKKDMFALLKKINSTLKPTKIIHIGHILDDDSDISYEWGAFDNLVILAKIEELKFIQDQRNKFNFSYDVVRESIKPW